ncbi:hypothetical protein L208DRAFT_1269203 [Tricholoma matsutake]|nr:hypothetical protein L208DRAFT_1269203 [Tricholoma matsutake 945]
MESPDRRELQKFQMSNQEWEWIMDIIGVLQFPHEVQQVMSKEKTPILAGAIPSFKRFMSRWERLTEKNAHLTPAIQIGLDFATKYYKQMDDTDAYVIAMCEYDFQVLNII